MCLVSKNNNVQIAKEPIIAYKILDWNYKSPYKEFDYSPYVENLGETIYDVIPTPFFDYMCGRYVVEEGLHLFIDLQHAKEYVEDGLDELIFKCEIPIGSYFIEGEYGEICADQFRFIERI